MPDESPQPADQEDYRNGPFPLEFEIAGANGSKHAVVYERVGEKLVGCFWFGKSRETASGVVPCYWELDGQYSKHGDYPTMDLPPPPGLKSCYIGKIKARLDALNTEQAEIDRRRESYPDLPAQWQAEDKRRANSIRLEIGDLTVQLEKLQ